MNDSMRYNLVTKFVCAACGTPLVIAYNPPANGAYAPEASDNITGAAKVEQRIGIHPCRKCYAEATEPMDALRKALGIEQSGKQR